jgi:hypothetical protein
MSAACGSLVVSIQKHLKHHGHKPVTLTVKLLAYWHYRINKECFNGGLNKVVITFGRSRICKDPVFGYYLNGRIHIDSRNKTKRELVNTMAHEMIHQRQDQSAESLNHGKTFTLWASALKEHGIDV